MHCIGSIKLLIFILYKCASDNGLLMDSWQISIFPHIHHKPYTALSSIFTTGQKGIKPKIKIKKKIGFSEISFSLTKKFLFCSYKLGCTNQFSS